MISRSDMNKRIVIKTIEDGEVVEKEGWISGFTYTDTRAPLFDVMLDDGTVKCSVEAEAVVKIGGGIERASEGSVSPLRNQRDG